ncbi:unnamed protein product [Owenia fusiformis]|uniref:Uncharacterized protein n=1 Tax=Owenia fusiformis TaxID=6347 RepID=A0A8J1XU46_OWEFU|nr:unnamed protein product [Owenia fusiformis]
MISRHLFQNFIQLNQPLLRKVAFKSTIFAVATPPRKSGVAVIRISGDRCAYILEKVAMFMILPQPRLVKLRRFYHPATGEMLDKGMVVWFKGPQSFTGEDCCELHIHGSAAVATAMMSALGTIHQCRQAEPGEFTKRAFHNGKLDLTEVEGLGELIHAETEAQRKQALRQLEGQLSQLYQSWRTRLIKCAANIEAFIDFSENDTLEDNLLEDVEKEVTLLTQDIQQHLADGRHGDRLRDGVRVAIVGEPNVGKSSLLNAMCRRPAAIVSSIEGTTRDIIETHLNIGGYPVLLSDTAGLRKTNNVLELEGIRRAIERAENADIILVVLEARKIAELAELEPQFNLNTYLMEHITSLGLTINRTDSVQEPVIAAVLNKIDLIGDSSLSAIISQCRKESDKMLSVTGKLSHTRDDSAKCDTREQNAKYDIREQSAKDETSDYSANLKYDTRQHKSDEYTVEYNTEQNETIFHSENISPEITNSSVPNTEQLFINNKDKTKRDCHTRTSTDDVYEEIPVVCTSCVSDTGISDLISTLQHHLEQMCTTGATESQGVCQARHRELLTECLYSLEKFTSLGGQDYAIAAQMLRNSHRNLGKVIGTVSTDDILDVIFRDFCIGK